MVFLQSILGVDHPNATMNFWEENESSTHNSNWILLLYPIHNNKINILGHKMINPNFHVIAFQPYMLTIKFKPQVIHPSV